MKIRLLAAASRDLQSGYRFYERQAEGVGVHFLETLFAEIDALGETGGVHPRYDGTYHRLLSRRFPFAVYYRVVDDVVLVYAVLDCRRSPAWIRRQLP